MKTKEEILIKYDYSDDELGDRLPYKDVNRDRWYHIDDILSAMDEYASLRESKWRELYEAWKELGNLMTISSTTNFGTNNRLRQKIMKLEQELGLTK